MDDTLAEVQLVAVGLGAVAQEADAGAVLVEGDVAEPGLVICVEIAAGDLGEDVTVGHGLVLGRPHATDVLAVEQQAFILAQHHDLGVAHLLGRVGDHLLDVAAHDFLGIITEMGLDAEWLPRHEHAGILHLPAVVLEAEVVEYQRAHRGRAAAGLDGGLEQVGAQIDDLLVIDVYPAQRRLAEILRRAHWPPPDSVARGISMVLPT